MAFETKALLVAIYEGTKKAETVAEVRAYIAKIANTEGVILEPNKDHAEKKQA